MTPREQKNRQQALDYIAAIQRGARGPDLAAFYAPDVVAEEFPNRISPRGATRDLPALLSAAERGRQVMASQRYEVLNAMASGDSVLLEFVWEGTLAITLGTLQPGSVMRCRSAMIIQFKDGKITAHRHYDCFDPW